MAVTKVSVCNSALIKVGADRISSITQDTKSARILNAIWDQSLDAALRAHPWNFAKKRVVLAPNSTTPEWGYSYQYDKPSDYIRPLKMDPSDIDYRVIGDCIESDESELDIEYIYRHVDFNAWPGDFAEAFAWKLGENGAYALTQSLALVESCRKGFRLAINEARAVNGMENPIDSLEADTWLNARR